MPAPRFPSLVASLLLTGCNYITDATLDAQLDTDSDGIAADLDCDPSDPSVSSESTFYIDADGDGLGAGEPVILCGLQDGYSASPGDLCDDDPERIQPIVYLADADGDGFGDPTVPIESCDPTPPPGAAIEEDCDDTDATVNEPQIWFLDGDQDGFGSTTVQDFCTATPPVGFAATADDCDDTNAGVNPAAVELCGPIDEDCDGLLDDDPDIENPLEVWLPDADGDGFGDEALFATTPPTRCPDPGLIRFDGALDCDDADSLVFPGADELCDSIDNDCNGDIDESFAVPAYFEDADLDGAPNTNETQLLCTPIPGWLLASQWDSTQIDAVHDCDDTDASIFPGAPEIWADGIDQDCDPLTEYDEDADGFPVANAPPELLDCNDQDPGVNPGAVEIFYDPVDDDCDPSNDNDADGDGFDALLAGGTDCDDADPDTNPGAVEIFYDGADNDCDPQTDDDDADGDGVQIGLDCNDNDPAVFPGAFEVPDGVDNNCDPNGYTGVLCYPDIDSDGFGVGSQVAVDLDVCGGAWALNGGDCDDNDASRNPSAVEWCDGIDSDCGFDIDVGIVTFTDAYGMRTDLTSALSAREVIDGTGNGPSTVDVCGYGAGMTLMLSIQSGADVLIRGGTRGGDQITSPYGTPMFTVATGSTVEIQNLTISGAPGTPEPLIDNSSSDLLLTNVAFDPGTLQGSALVRVDDGTTRFDGVIAVNGSGMGTMIEAIDAGVTLDDVDGKSWDAELVDATGSAVTSTDIEANGSDPVIRADSSTLLLSRLQVDASLSGPLLRTVDTNVVLLDATLDAVTTPGVLADIDNGDFTVLGGGFRVAGGRIDVTDGDVTMRDVFFDGFAVPDSPTWIRVDDGDLSIENCDISVNTATQPLLHVLDGDVDLESVRAYGYGGAPAFLDQSFGTLDMQSTSVEHYGVQAQAGGDATVMRLDSVFSNGQTLTIRNRVCEGSTSVAPCSYPYGAPTGPPLIEIFGPTTLWMYGVLETYSGPAMAIRGGGSTVGFFAYGSPSLIGAGDIVITAGQYYMETFVNADHDLGGGTFQIGNCTVPGYGAAYVTCTDGLCGCP